MKSIYNSLDFTTRSKIINDVGVELRSEWLQSSQLIGCTPKTLIYFGANLTFN